MSAATLLTPCPTEDRLRALLSGELRGKDFAALESHIELCQACQDTLARLSGGFETVQWSDAGEESPGGLAREFLARLQRASPAGGLPVEFPQPPTADAPLGRLGSYDILKQLGRGGMGAVFLARDTQLDHLVALKVLRPELAAEATERERFYREGRAAAAVKNDHIVTVHAAQNSSAEFSLPYLVMEYVEGESLDQALKRQGAFDPLEAAQIALQAARGLQAAHDQGLIHRDIKPSNIMLQSRTGRVKIMDFGLARRLDADENLTRYGNVVGTPAYMSPEQVLDAPHLSQASDVFSLGVVLYELLTDERPFRGSQHLVLQQIVHEEPRPPRGLNDAIPRDLETICLKCLRKSTADRYLSAGALASDLQRLLNREPIEARPVSRFEKLRMWCQRNPRIAIPTAASIVLFCLAFGVVSWSNWALAAKNVELLAKTEAATQARRQESEARTKETQAREQEAQARAEEVKTREFATIWADGGLLATRDLITKLRSVKAPGLVEVKQDLLKTMHQRLEKLPEITGRSGTTLAGTMLQYHRLMHELNLDVGHTDKAWDHLSKAHAIARQRIIDQNRSTASRINLADICREMAQLRRQQYRDMAVAAKFAREAVATYEDVLDKPSEKLPVLQRFELMYRLSQAQSLIASTLARLGDPEQALNHYEQSLRVLEGIRADPENKTQPAETLKMNAVFVREQSVPMLAGSGDMNFRLGRFEIAQARYKEVVASREETLRQNPTKPVAKQWLAEMLSQAGYVLMVTGDLAGAADYLDRAVKYQQELVALDGALVPYKQKLGLAHFRRGILKQLQQESEAAEADFQACLAIRTDLAKDATNVDRQRELLLILPRGGKSTEAVELAERLLAATPKPDIELLLDVARAYAQCAVAVASDMPSAEAYRAKSLATLQQAVKLGHRDPVYLEHEPDFAEIRDDPAFRTALLSERQAPAAVNP